MNASDTSNIDDPKPVEYSNDWWGKISYDVREVAVVKGLPDFDPSRHNERQRGTQAKFYIDPLSDTKLVRPFEKPVILNFDEWRLVGKVSLDRLGTKLSQLQGKWAHGSFPATGKEYPKKDSDGKPTGEVGQSRTIDFLAIYASEDECRAAYLAETGGGARSDSNGNAPVLTAQQQNMKSLALQFIESAASNVPGGKDPWLHIQEFIAANGICKQFFNADSPEVAVIMAKAGHELQFQPPF